MATNGILEALRHFGLILIACSLSLPVQARTLTYADGRKVEAELVGLTGGQATLRSGTREFAVPINFFSRDDQEFIRRLASGGTKSTAPAVPSSPHRVNQTVRRTYSDRFVWIFGWELNKDSDVGEMSTVLQTASQHGFNGAVVRLGPSNFRFAEYAGRAEQLRQACERNKMELIPAIFQVGGGGPTLMHHPNLAEGLPVKDALLVVSNGEARLLSEPLVHLANGDFERFSGNRFASFQVQDQPGEVSFVDKNIKHGGSASLRLENFTANQYSCGKVSQAISVRPRRCYRTQLWVKTVNLQPASSFSIIVLAGNRQLFKQGVNLAPTTDWRRVTLVFNSMDATKLTMHVEVWRGKAGKLWLDDWTLEEIGPLNVLRRSGTPVAVRSDAGNTLYVEGRDYASLQDPNYGPFKLDRDVAPLKILPSSRIVNGQRLRVSWFHSVTIGQLTPMCMGAPELYQVFDQEAKVLAEKLHPRRVLLNMDEIRMGGSCAACRGRNMGELLGECITKQAQIVRRHMPGAEIYVWSDMLDPNDNAHANYFLVEGNFAGACQHIPKDIVIAVWNRWPREKSLKFFTEQKFRILAACYYDAPDLESVKQWMNAMSPLPNVRGFMYTSWEKKYDLLPQFGALFSPERKAP